MNFDADMVDTQLFLPFLEGLLRDRGVEFVLNRRFEVISEIERLPEEHLFNCLGYFSSFIFKGIAEEMKPIRGQSHFIRKDLPPPYHGVASGHHAVFRHPRGFYLGSYFLEDEKHTWVKGKKGESVTTLQTVPTSIEMDLTRAFATETYPLLTAALGFPAEPVPLDGQDGIWRVNTGIRPMMEKGPFNGSKDYGSKIVHHNIGHGAHGWTIGYGSVVIAVDKFESGRARG
jgi:glycine/D-amino acid oxidase-like deaminating enzyme